MVKRLFLFILAGSILAGCSFQTTPASSAQSRPNRPSFSNSNDPSIITTDTPTPLPPSPTPGLTPSATPLQMTPTDTPTAFHFLIYLTNLEADPALYTGLCDLPVVVTFNGSITSTAAGTVTYHFVRSDGYADKPQTLVFTQAQTLPISTAWSKIPVSGQQFSGWEQIFIDSPNNQAMAKASFTLACHQGDLNKPGNSGPKIK